MPKLTVLLSDEQHIAVKIKAAQARLPQTAIARKLLMMWLKDEITLPHDTEETSSSSDNSAQKQLSDNNASQGLSKSRSAAKKKSKKKKRKR